METNVHIFCIYKRRQKSQLSDLSSHPETKIVQRKPQSNQIKIKLKQRRNMAEAKSQWNWKWENRLKRWLFESKIDKPIVKWTKKEEERHMASIIDESKNAHTDPGDMKKIPRGLYKQSPQMLQNFHKVYQSLQRTQTLTHVQTQDRY